MIKYSFILRLLIMYLNSCLVNYLWIYINNCCENIKNLDR